MNQHADQTRTVLAELTPAEIDQVAGGGLVPIVINTGAPVYVAPASYNWD